MSDPIRLCACGCGQPTNFNHGRQRKFRKGHHIRLPENHPKTATPVADRIKANVVVNEAGCWIWQLGKGKSGYGQIKINGTSRGVHKVSYETFVAPVPDGLHVDHLCHTNDLSCPGGQTCPHRLCVNPDHLEVVTPAENYRRSRADPMKNFAGVYAQRRGQTECPHGHPWNEENTRYYTYRGYRQRICLTCQRERARRRRGTSPENYRPIGDDRETLCKRGHELTEENTIRGEDGRRRCRACANDLRRQSYHDRQADADRTPRLGGQCRNGHEYDATNTYIDPAGQRQCRACRAEQQRRRRKDQRGRINSEQSDGR